MKNKIAVFLSCIFIFLNILYAQPVAAGEPELPAVKVALTDDMSIIIYRILYEAVKRSGYQMIPQVTGMRTAITDVNYGGAAILALQTEDWEKRYDNLIKVPVIINNVEFIAYTRSGDTNTFSGWGDIAGLRLGYRWQNEYVANNLHRTGADKFTAVTTYDELWRSLSNNETDVVILPANQHFEHKIPQGIRKAGVIDVLPCYTYINKKYAHLLPLLTNAYREMHADGTMELIYNSRKLSGEKEIILHINSYNTQIEWEYRHMETIRRTLSQDFQFEYRSIDLSSNELHSQAGFNTVITDLIRTDYIMRYPDLIIASGNEALEFVLNNYYVLFPKTPVVFFGTLGLNHSTLHGFESYITGISESISFHETVTQMLRLYPGTRRIFILNDGSLSRSRILREYIHDRIGTLGLQAEFIFNDDKPFPEILEDIRGFGQDTLVLIGNYLIDSGGASYSEKDVKKMVASASENPVFCMNAPYIGYGTLGGLVMCPDLQSGMVTSMAADILNGIHPAEIPAIFNSTTFNKWMFDHETVNRFSIKKYLLPQGHVIVNRLLPVWESNPHEFKLALALALLLLMIILGLILFSKMLAKKQKEAEAASRAKSAFLANMSHEIRTPMNSIIGFSELALDNRITPKTKEYLDMIIKNAKGLLQIINDILDISKIESGSVHLESIPFDLGELLESCRNIIQPKAKEKNISLRFYAEAPADKMLIGDPTRLRQVLVNLLFNAVKFTDSGCVKLTVLMNSETKNDVDLRFEVEDTGIGMTDEQITKIFEPFTQGDISTTRKYGGTGLGLTISKNILDLLDSKLEIHSIPGTGTIIAFNLTYKLTDAEGMLKQTTESPDAAGKTVKPRFTGNILVCEDNQMNQKVIAEHLTRVGLNFEIAENGRKGVEMVRWRIDNRIKPFDLILMDIHMPVMDGLEAASKIMEMGTGTHIVAMTANIMTDDRELYEKAGMADYLGKPFLSQELINCLLRHLEPVGYTDSSAPESEEDDRKNKLQEELKADFVKNNQTTLVDIRNAILSGDVNLPYRLVHTLKNCAALIGKTALHKAAVETETVFRDNGIFIMEEARPVNEIPAAVQASMEKLRVELSAVLEELKPYLAVADDPAHSGGRACLDTDSALTLLEKLRPMLACGSPESLAMLDEVRNIPGSNELVQQIEELFFSEALEELLKLREKLKPQAPDFGSVTEA